MKKDQNLSSDKKETENNTETEDAGKHLNNDEINISRKSEENLIDRDLSQDILDENKEEILDNIEDTQTLDKKRLLPPPGIPVKKKQTTENISEYGNKDGQEGAGRRTRLKWVKNGKEKSSEIESYLQKIYYDTRHAASYSSVEKLYNYIKSNSDKKIPRKYIKMWLSKQESYTAHRPVR